MERIVYFRGSVYNAAGMFDKAVEDDTPGQEQEEKPIVTLKSGDMYLSMRS